MIIKTAITFAMIVIFSGRIYAQQDMQSNTQNVEIDYAKKIKTFRTMRGVGAVFTVVGSIVLVSGVITMANSAGVDGMGLFAAGFVTLGAGIPLWIIGGVNYKKYSRRQELSVKLNTSQNSRGLTLTYRF